MNTDFDYLLSRVNAALNNQGVLTCTLDTLTEGIRLALGEYGLSAGQPVTLGGLDGAAVTSLPANHYALIVWGAAGYAALASAASRAAEAQLGPEPAALLTWGDQRLKEFRAMLAQTLPDPAEVTRLSGLRTSADVPWRAWIDSSGQDGVP